MSLNWFWWGGGRRHKLFWRTPGKMVTNGKKKAGQLPKAKPKATPAARAIRNARARNEMSKQQQQILQPTTIAATTGIPQMGNLGNGNMRVRHREFFADVNGNATGVFTVQSFSVNPGQASLFPWLSTVANRFEKYRFRRLEIDYQPACSVTTVGTVMAAYDTDAADPAPTSKVQLMAYQNAARSAPWGRYSTHCPLVGQGDRYVRRGGVPQNTDIKTYDMATLFVAISSTAAAGQLGELYVEYDVDLMVPQLADSFVTAMLGSGLATQGADPWRFSPNVSGTLVVTPSPNNAGFLAIATNVGAYLLVTVDVKGATIVNITVASAAGLGNNLLTQVGTTSQTVTATSATSVSCWRVDGLVSGQSSINAQFNGQAMLSVLSAGAQLAIADAITLSVSPWETGLLFL